MRNGNNKFTRFLSGVGSVLNIYPSTDYQRFVSNETPAERMAARWRRVGESLHRSVNQFALEQEQRHHNH